MASSDGLAEFREIEVMILDDVAEEHWPEFVKRALTPDVQPTSDFASATKEDRKSVV